MDSIIGPSDDTVAYLFQDSCYIDVGKKILIFLQGCLGRERINPVSFRKIFLMRVNTLQ